MNSLKKVISLNQAAKLSGYTQDYLGYLVRKGEIKATKKGKVWFTTEEEVNNYIFKKKVLHKELAIKDFFSPTRSKRIFWAVILITIFFSFVFLSNVSKKNFLDEAEIQSAEVSDGDSLSVPNKN